MENYFFVYFVVYDVVMVLMLDDFFGEWFCVFVILKGEVLKLGELKVFLCECGLVVYKIFDWIEFIVFFLKIGVGKVSKKDFCEMIVKKLKFVEIK